MRRAAHFAKVENLSDNGQDSSTISLRLTTLVMCAYFTPINISPDFPFQW